MNYGTLKGRVHFYLKRDDVSAIYPQIQELANTRIASEANLIAMEVDLELDFTSQPTADLPADFSRFKEVLATCNGRTYDLPVYSRGKLANLTAGRNRGGCPNGYAIYSNMVEVAPWTEERKLQTTYYAVPAIMQADEDTNSILDRWPTLYLFAFLQYAANSLQDIDLQNVYDGEYQSELLAANQSDAFARMSGSAPRFQE